MTVSLIAAVAANRVIGDRGRLPWRIPDDLARFRRLTLGHAVIMGRATFESLGRAALSNVPGRAPPGRAALSNVPGRAPLGRPLPGRTNIVLTRRSGFHAEGCIIVHSAEEALAAAQTVKDAAGAMGAPADSAEVFVMGGAGVFALFLPMASRLYITWIDAAVSGDALFPEVEWKEWRAARETPGSDSPLPHRFTDYERIL